MEKGRNIILKLGSRTIECGYEGYFTPLEVFNVYHFAEKQNFICDNKPFDEINQYQNKDISCFNYLFNPNISIYNDLDLFKLDLHNHLIKVFTKIFYKCGISTMNAKLILLHKSLFPDIYLNVITKLLIERFRMRAVVLLPSALMSTISSGSDSSIVIDIGWSYTCIEVVSDNRLLTNYTQVTDRAGCMLHYAILRQLKDLGFDISDISFRDVEKMVSSINSLDMNPSDELICGNYSIKAEIIIETIQKVLINKQTNLSDDINELQISELVSTLIEKTLPVDIRQEVSSKIIINSGLTKIKGFEKLLYQEIEKQMKKKIQLVCIDSIGEWSGACIYSSFMKGLRKNSNLLEIREIKNKN